MYRAWRLALQGISDVKGLYPTFVINLAPAGAARVGRDNGIGNVWGLEDTPMILERLHNANRKNKISSEFVYMGDAGEWQDPFAGFPAENVRRIKVIQKNYDPQGVFTRLNTGGFKLSTV
ncbi:oxidoreductase FAD binding domain protein [Aspergillus affinis]|uniref:oxidoreductase FAD binding domain protein n=1 Tax=Aspergillus affinis TaxID=1070780 RepID=UPI0022FE659C|nr:oxidoreductase FAD binding domain protein [Aspergillus affinis]KAI9038096.1 oxidoreductase FAD binding domain protein [Aspergillus affinis]